MSTVLIVENNTLNCKMLDRQLQHCGYRVLIATDGNQGINQAIKEQPDLVIMSTDLPAMDGWQAVRVLKASPITAQIPIIALTTQSKTDNWKTALEAGCNDYDTKPIVFKRLLGKVKSLLENTDAASEDTTKPSISTTASLNPPESIPNIFNLTATGKTKVGALNNRYQIVQNLDDSFFGQRFLANDLNAAENTTVIIKSFELPNDNLSLQEAVRDFLTKQLELIKVISRQDTIATCLDYFEENNTFYWVQEQIIGHPLTLELDGAQTMGHVLKLTHSLLTNVQPFHQSKLVHCACHPQSFLLQKSDKRLVLVEYGLLSRLFINLKSKSLKYRQALLKQRDYQTIEQRLGDPQPDSDIYSIGMIMLQCLTGQSQNWLTATLGQGNLTTLINADPKIVKLFERMVNPNQQLRFQSASDALAALPLGLIPKTNDYRQAFSS